MQMGICNGNKIVRYDTLLIIEQTNEIYNANGTLKIRLLGII